MHDGGSRPRLLSLTLFTLALKQGFCQDFPPQRLPPGGPVPGSPGFVHHALTFDRTGAAFAIPLGRGSLATRARVRWGEWAHDSTILR
jgi:hypothetical protein